jgi:hypothetical protein
VTYDRALMRHLRGQPDVKFLDAEAWLDQVIPTLGALPQAEVERLWKELGPYYFDCNDDRQRETPFRARLGLPAR